MLPPGTHPGSPTAPYGWMPPAPIQPVSTSLAGWLSGLFWAIGALSVLSTLAALYARGAFESFADALTRSRYDDWNAADSLFRLVSVIELPVRLGLFVVLVVWCWKCHKAAAGLNPGKRRWSAGWTIGAWFIPFASIVLPKLVIDETEKIATAPRSGGNAVGWQQVKVSKVGTAWWWLFIASGLIATSAGFGDRVYNGPADRSSISGYYVAVAISGLVGAVSAVCGAIYSKDLSRALSTAGIYGQRATSGVGTLTVAGDPNASVQAWAARTAHASAFCDICREPLSAEMSRCPRCGKRRQPSGAPS